MIIRQSKVEIATDPGDTGRLSYKFSRLRKKPCDIGGNNLFIGLCSNAARAAVCGPDDPSFAVFQVDSREGWEDTWAKLGTKPPGDLPRGAMAMFYFTNAADDMHNGVDVAKIERHFGALGSTIFVNWTTHQEQNTTPDPARAGFAALLFPRTLGGNGYAVTSGVAQSTMIGDYLAARISSPSASTPSSTQPAAPDANPAATPAPPPKPPQ